MQTGNRYKVWAVSSTVLCVVLAIALVLSPSVMPYIFHGNIEMNFTIHSLHTRILILKGDKVILDEYHAGALTRHGMNFTLGCIVKNSTSFPPYYNSSYWKNDLLNLTFVSIGNAYATWTCNNTQPYLPKEWNRTAGSQGTFSYNSFNVTATFYPDAGPYTADCIGLNWKNGINDRSEWGYDTFTEVTGIDDTFTIIVQIKVTIS